MANHQNSAPVTGQLDELLGFGNLKNKRFLNVDIFARKQCRFAQGVMARSRRGNHNRLQLAVLQQVLPTRGGGRTGHLGLDLCQLFGI